MTATRILGIETSCDETAAAVVVDGRSIASNVVASQVDLHARYGGVFPEVASRAHAEGIGAVVQEALAQAHTSVAAIDAIAVTRGPGLVGSLLVGLNYAKGLAIASGKPLIGAHHIEGHVYSLWPAHPQHDFAFPLLALVVSGGHTDLLLMTGHGVYRRLGGTRDDAAGEAFDKVGRLLGLPYPGGPHIERAAQGGSAEAFAFPRARKIDDTLDFSFSGLKTAVLNTVAVGGSARAKDGLQLRSGVSVADVAASFQAALVDMLVEKTVRAAAQNRPTAVLLAGGVSANGALRQALSSALSVPVLYPPLALCTDNAAMIAAAGHVRFLQGVRTALEADVIPTWPLDGDPHVDEQG